ncbi:MAG: hypothetical protein ACKVZJ_06890 [Phycisphaerales bacterium]
MRRTSVFFASAALALAAGSASAVPLFDFVLSENGLPVYSAFANPGSWTSAPIGGGAFLIQGSYASGTVSFDYQLTLKSDPFATANFNLTNTSGALGLYSTSLTLAVTPVAAPSSYQGSISGSIGDDPATSNGALLSAAPALYEALVDGGVFQVMYPAPFALAEPFGGLTADLPALNFAGAGGPAVANSIGLRSSFTLTNGDSVGLVTRFDIVPTPGAASMLAVAGLVGLRRRR